MQGSLAQQRVTDNIDTAGTQDGTAKRGILRGRSADRKPIRIVLTITTNELQVTKQPRDSHYIV